MTGGALEGYEARIGRYGGALAHAFMDAVGVEPGQRALDVGCGSGALTEALAERLGTGSVVGIDPAPAAVKACRARVPGVDVRAGFAEELPFENGEFDLALAQLVIAFMTDAPKGVAEMARVCRPGGTVAACVWDFAAGMTVLRTFWDAARTVTPLAAQHDQASTHAYSQPPEMERLWQVAGLSEVRTGELVVDARYSDFEDLWRPMTTPDGSPGRFFEILEAHQQATLRERTWERLGRPRGSFRLAARSWYVVGQA